MIHPHHLCLAVEKMQKRQIAHACTKSQANLSPLTMMLAPTLWAEEEAGRMLHPADPRQIRPSPKLLDAPRE
jgi:hypothetical protein